MRQGEGWNRFAEMAEGIGSFVSKRRRVGRVADSDGIEDDEERLFHFSNTHGMPGGLELEGVEDAVGITGRVPEPIFGRSEGMIVNPFEVVGRAPLKRLEDCRITRSIDHGIHIEVGREPRGKFGAFSGEEIDDAARQIACGESFGEGKGGQGSGLGSESDAGVA